MDHLIIGEGTDWCLTVYVDPTKAMRAALVDLAPESLTVPGARTQSAPLVEVRGTADTRTELVAAVSDAYAEVLARLDTDADPSVLELYPPDGTGWTVERLTPGDLMRERLGQRLADLEVDW